MRIPLPPGRSPWKGVLVGAVVLALGLSACGGTTEEVVPPTRVNVGTTQPETTPPLPADVTEQVPALSQPVLPTGDAPLEFTPEVTPPLSDGPVPNTDLGGTLPAPSPEAILDFSTLVLGDRVLLAGTLNVVQADGAETLVITDPNDISLQMSMPPSLLPNLIGSQVEVFGEIYDMTSTDAGESPAAEATPDPSAVVLAIRAESVSPVGVGIAAAPGDVPGFAPESTDGPEGFPANLAEVTAQADVPPFGDGTLPAPPIFAEGTPAVDFAQVGPGAVQGELLDFGLEPDLTALQAYDALLSNITDDIEGRTWIMLRGSTLQGWTLDFYSAETNDNLTYVVLPTGEVSRIPPSPALPFQNSSTVAIDRAALVLDSIDVETYVESLGQSLTEEVQLILSASEIGVTWTSIANTSLVLVATAPIDEQIQLTPTAGQ